VLGLCLMTVFLCGNGDFGYSLASIHADNYTLSTGIRNLTMCLFKEVKKSPNTFFALLDLAITFLLFIIFVYESVWELAVFLLSNSSSSPTGSWSRSSATTRPGRRGERSPASGGASAGSGGCGAG
jgi:hypothetical protein